MAKKTEIRQVDIEIKNPHDGKEIVVSLERGENFITIRFLGKLEEYMAHASNIAVIKKDIEKLTISYKREIEIEESA